MVVDCKKESSEKKVTLLVDYAQDQGQVLENVSISGKRVVEKSLKENAYKGQ